MKRIRAYGIIPGDMTPGPLNKISDVAGVTVGHAAVNTAEHKTGVTVILPCEDNPYRKKLTAAAYIHNGFGKSQGAAAPETEHCGIQNVSGGPGAGPEQAAG